MSLDGQTFPTPSRQIVIATALAAVLVVVLVAVYLLLFRQPYAVLFNRLKPADAATIVAELDRKKAPYRLRDGGGTILVPQKAVDATRLSIMNADLPIKGMVGFELFNKNDMGLTEFAQRINYQRALQGELARTIMTLEGVDTARVHLAITEPTIFRDDRKPPKASVTIVPVAGSAMSPATVAGVQRLVAAAVPELDTANVVILNEKGAIISQGGSAAQDGVQPITGKAEIQRYYAGRIRAVLGQAFPTEVQDVTVIADVDALDLAGAPPQAGGPSTGWSPQLRNFRLRTAVTISGSLTPQVREDARGMVAEAIGYDAGLGDVVTISLPQIPAGQSSQVVAAPAVPTATAPRAKADGAIGWPWLVGGLALVGVLAGAALLLWRQIRPPALSAAQRERYVRRLKHLLTPEDDDVVLSA